MLKEPIGASDAGWSEKRHAPRTPDTLKAALARCKGASPSTLLPDDSFAAWCYDRLSIRELRSKFRRDPDPEECHGWRLTPREWRNQVEMALIARQAAGREPF